MLLLNLQHLPKWNVIEYDNQLIIFKIKLDFRSNSVIDELTFNASDNDAAPDSPILFEMEYDSIIIY